MDDGFTQFLGKSLQELHNSLLVEYQRAWDSSGDSCKAQGIQTIISPKQSLCPPSILQIPETQSDAPQNSIQNSSAWSPVSLLNSTDVSKGQEQSSRRNVSFLSVMEAPALVSEAPAVLNSRVPAENMGRISKISFRSDVYDKCNSSPPGSDRGSTLQAEGEMFDVHPLFNEKITKLTMATNKKTVRDMQKAVPTASKIMGTMDFDDELAGGADRSCLDRFDFLVSSPTARLRLYWELFGAMLVLYDVCHIPLQLSFKLPKSAFTTTIAWTQRIYWTSDCMSLFIVGYTSRKGFEIMRMRLIVKHYLRTWFLLDGLLVACDWFDYVGMQGGFNESSKTIRVIRLLKLLRIARIISHLPDALDSIDSSHGSPEGLKIILSTMKMMFLAALVLHVIACSWHAIGSWSLPNDSGWLYFHIFEPSTVIDTSIAHIYLVSYHWSVTQVIGSADVPPNGPLERVFAIVVLFLALVISASVVSSITTSMTAIQFITSQKEKQLDRLRKYLASHNIQSAIAHRVLQNAMYAVEEGSRNVQESEVELLRIISEPLYIELHHAMYKEYLDWHPFFAYYMTKNKQAGHQICHVCLAQNMIHGGDVLFSHSEQKQQPQMYFLLSGKMIYVKAASSTLYLEPGNWAAEPVLWTNWTHRGNLRAKQPCNILCLDSNHFQSTANQFKSAAFWPAVYAQGFVALLSEIGSDDLSDLFDQWALDVYSLAVSIFEEDTDRDTFMARADKSIGHWRSTKLTSAMFGSSKITRMKSRKLSNASFKSSQRASEIGRAKLSSCRESLTSDAYNESVPPRTRSDSTTSANTRDGDRGSSSNGHSSQDPREKNVMFRIDSESETLEPENLPSSILPRELS